jgi:hypothetical protein
MILTTEQMDGLALARYEFALRARERVALPPYLGTALRGAFGHALKAIACAMPHGECGRCLLAERCRYPLLFETPAGGAGLLAGKGDAPRPYIFEPPAPVRQTDAPDEWLWRRVRVPAGGSFGFGLTLFGEALRDAPYFVYAVSLMAQHGLGVERASFALTGVAVADAASQPVLVYTPEMPRLRPHAEAQTTLGAWVQTRLAELSVKDEITLELLTPLRLRVGKRLAEELDFALLVKMLSLRLSMMFAAHGAAPLDYDYRALLERARAVRVAASELQLQALARRSNRRDDTIELDGLLGRITFAGPQLAEFLPLLAAGEILHCGSGTVFGLGGYRLSS